MARAKLKIGSEVRLGTDPIAFICGSIFFASPQLSDHEWELIARGRRAREAGF